MKTHFSVIDAFVIEHLEAAPIDKQIAVSEAMAATATTPETSKRWSTHAKQLRSVSENVQQMWFTFRRNAK